MTIFDIQLAVSVAQTRSFSEAAFVCSLSQSSLSKHISQLEQELGVRLFDRSTRTLRITQAGELFLLYGKTILETHRTMLDSIRALEQQELRVGIIRWLYNDRLSESFSDFFGQSPELRLNLSIGNTSELVSMLERGGLDLAIGVLQSEITQRTHLTTYPLAQDELVAAVSRRHPLAGRESVALTELAGERFIALDASSSTSLIIRDLCERCRFTPKVVHRCPDPKIMLDFVCRDQGIAIFARRIILELAGALPDLRHVPLRPAAFRTIGIIVRSSSLSEEKVQAFLEYILACNRAASFLDCAAPGDSPSTMSTADEKPARS